MNKSLVIKLLIPYVLLVGGFLFEEKIRIGADLTPAESGILSTEPSNIAEYEEVLRAKPVESLAALDARGKRPFLGRIKQYRDSEFPSESLAELAPQSGPGVSATPPPLDPSSFPVSMIIVSDDKRYALMHNTLVWEGVNIQGTEITKIEEDRVLISNSGQSTWINLSKGKSK